MSSPAPSSLRARVNRLESDLADLRTTADRVEALTDVVVELLLPADQRDVVRLENGVARLRDLG